MKTTKNEVYLAEWPDGTHSIVRAECIAEAIIGLDAIADPSKAKIYILPDEFVMDFEMMGDFYCGIVKKDLKRLSKKKIEKEVIEMIK